MTNQQRAGARKALNQYPGLDVAISDGGVTPFMKSDPSRRGALVVVGEATDPATITSALGRACRELMAS